MPEFTREELEKLHTLLGELGDCLRIGPSYAPSSGSTDDLIKDAREMNQKIMSLLYPPS